MGTVVLLLLIGVAALFSASVVESHKDFGDIYAYFTHQLLYGVGLGVLIAFIIYKVPYKKWKVYALPLLLGAIFLLLFVFIPPFGVEAGGARRWISIGGFSFQPSEFAKLAFVIYLAAWFDGRHGMSKHWSTGFAPFLIMVGIFGSLLVLQPDIGTLGVVSFTAIFMYFLAGANVSQMGVIAILSSAILYFLVKMAPYRLERFLAFFNNAVDPLGISYQINQALLAIGSGGLVGLGFGKGVQKYNFLPEAMKDSIFAVWSEEMGFIGGLVLIGAFLILGLRGLKTAKNTSDRFGKYLASGITFWLITQTFVNVGSMLGLIPLTGIPLPLVSYGGSAMIATLAGLGILLNISKYS